MQNTLPDLSPIFQRYETLMAEVDALFTRVRSAHPECVACHEGCSDCCHALFDLPLVEAVYLRHKFGTAFPIGAERSAMLERAGQSDRQIHKIKRNAFSASQSGMDNDAILAAVGKERSRCPLLDEDDRCIVYESRPVTCRIYGIPTAIGGKGYTCGRSRFLPGQAYPTVHLEKIHERLASLSQELAAHVGSRYGEVHAVLVPVSMALLTNYDAAYFGLNQGKKGGPARG